MRESLESGQNGQSGQRGEAVAVGGSSTANMCVSLLFLHCFPLRSVLTGSAHHCDDNFVLNIYETHDSQCD